MLFRLEKDGLFLNAKGQLTKKGKTWSSKAAFVNALQYHSQLLPLSIYDTSRSDGWYVHIIDDTNGEAKIIPLAEFVIAYLKEKENKLPKYLSGYYICSACGVITDDVIKVDSGILCRECYKRRMKNATNRKKQ